ncbi:MAG TPA: Gfo/Idh/MocA family oxidoreductase [Candidatus Hydrogenedentes bacterium]|nr:Gfo/Idh/MocA family oxidoreductase [Candidatus Hydrogenedentota bacterium]
MDSEKTSRRGFLKTAAVAAGAYAVTRIAPARALGANERIRFAVVGCGGRGSGALHDLMGRGEADNVEVVAASDVYQRRLSGAAAACNGAGYLDYRKLLERTDIDAVFVATPDHWHAKISIDALESGKHVYVEKPMTHTIEQALELRDTVKRTGNVLQVGPQDTAQDTFWKAHKAIKAGRIGKVTWLQGSYNRNARTCLFNDHQRIDPTAGPDKAGEDYVDWDMFLGHRWGLAPKRAWEPDRFFRFRKYWDYSGGVATDLLYHKLAPFLLAVAGPDGEYPKRVNANGGLYIEKDEREIPDTFLMAVDYPSEYSAFLVSTLTNDTGLANRIYGKYGTMDVNAGADPVLWGNGAFGKEFMDRNGGEGKERIPVSPLRDMTGNFIDAVRGRAQVYCNADLGCSTMVAIRMAVDSYRKNKTLLWDAKKERAIG